MYDAVVQADRRNFIKSGVAWTALSQSRVFGANERIRVAGLGTGGRCRYLLELLKKIDRTDLVATCDVYEPRRLEVKAIAGVPDTRDYRDHREVLDRKDVDAVVIGSPDHWHVPMVLDALKAGKDVYCEKPVTHTIAEGDSLIAAVRDSSRIVQIGTQQRSWPHFAEARDLVTTGKIGKITLIRTYWYQDYLHRGNPKPIDPAKLDWNRWLGSAPEQAFDENKYRTWRWFWDFGGGALTDLYCHWIDVVHWYMGSDTPEVAQVMGERYVRTDWDAPDTINGSFRYPNFHVVYDGTMVCALEDGGLVFRGTEGMLKIDRGGFAIYPENGSSRMPPPSVEQRSKQDGTIDHLANWLDCIKSRKIPNAPVEAGVAAARSAHIGNLALKRNQIVRWPE